MPAHRRPQVLVVGAGLAGLTAARRLNQQGIDVVVLEARDRVGGRVWSHTLDNGEIVELGGEWISTSQSAVVDFARDLGLGLVDTGMDFSSRDPVGGPPIPAEEHERLSLALAERMADLGPEVLAALPASDLLDSLGEGGPAMSVLRSRLEGTAGADLGAVAAAEIGEEFGVGGDGGYVRVDGGNDRLAKAIAADLEVRLDTVVTSIHQSDDRVAVVSRNREHEASALILAVPLPVARRLVFEPDLPEEVLSVLDALRMGSGVKVAAATEKAPSLFRRQDTDIPAWYWTSRRSDGGVRAAVTGFAGSGAGVSALLAEPRARMERAAPEVDLGPIVSADWVSDLFAGGCYSVIGPGQRSRLEVLTRPWGRVVMAGEHVNGSGTMAGAILSGEDAARRVMRVF